LLISGCVLRGNEVLGGYGPGMWFDWENYNNRIEGNLFKDLFGFGVGIEASPGPNLVTNNLIVGNKPGGGPFCAGICTWSSNGLLAVNNTMDGRWSPTSSDGVYDSGASGFMTHEGPDNRGTRWDSLPSRTRTILDNLTMGYPSFGAVFGGPSQNVLRANYTDAGSRAIALGGGFLSPQHAPVRDYQQMDYRLKPGNPLARAGVQDRVTALVSHDFFGLPRFAENGRSVGAFRADPLPKNPKQPQLEVELTDGTFKRQNEIISPRSKSEVCLADALALSIPPIAKPQYYPDLESVGGQTDAQAQVPVVWNYGYIPSTAYDDQAGLTKRETVLPATQIANSTSNRYVTAFGSVLQSDEFGLAMSGRTAVICTVQKAFHAVIYAHAHSIETWGGARSGRLFLQRRPAGIAPCTLLWQSEKVDDLWIDRAYCAAVDLHPGDQLVLAYESKDNGIARVDFRVGILPDAQRK
jgi:hypothetical protein